jgi:hypothetical protein
MITKHAVSSAQSSAVAVNRGERHDGIEVMVEAPPPGASCCVREGAMAPRQHDGAEQLRRSASKPGLARRNAASSAPSLIARPNNSLNRRDSRR